MDPKKSSRWLRITAISLALGLLCILLAWGFATQQHAGRGKLSIAYAGLTNDPSGSILVQFDVSNSFSRRVHFGICEVQLWQTNSWPNWMRVAGGSNWLTVAAGSHVIFSLPPPSAGNAVWRVPLMYQEDLPMRWSERVGLFAWRVTRWRPG